jgi:hypothetical protein
MDLKKYTIIYTLIISEFGFHACAAFHAYAVRFRATVQNCFVIKGVTEEKRELCIVSKYNDKIMFIFNYF